MGASQAETRGAGSREEGRNFGTNGNSFSLVVVYCSFRKLDRFFHGKFPARCSQFWTIAVLETLLRATLGAGQFAGRFEDLGALCGCECPPFLGGFAHTLISEPK